MYEEKIRKELKGLQEDKRDFVKDFMPEFLELKNNSWTFALLNPRENKYFQMTTSGKQDVLAMIIQWLKTYLVARQKQSVVIDDKTFIIERVYEGECEEKDKMDFRVVSSSGEVLFHTNAYAYYLIYYFYTVWLNFIFEEADFDIPYFDKDITQIKSDALGIFSLNNYRKPIDFDAWKTTYGRWERCNDNLRKAKWCLLAAKTKRILIDGKFRYSIDDKLLSDNEIVNYICDMEKIVALLNKSVISFNEMYMVYDRHKTEYYLWEGALWVTIKNLCGMKNVEIEIGGRGDSEQEAYAIAVATLLFCPKGLDSALC
jgi:hypothetical protein